MHEACFHAVSSEAVLGGQKSPYKLLVRAANQHTGAEVSNIMFVASEDFVVRPYFSRLHAAGTSYPCLLARPIACSIPL